MELAELVGTWELIGTVSWTHDAEDIARITTEGGRERVTRQWLRGERMEDAPPVRPVEGLRLDINNEAVLTEELTVADVRCEWFDAEGLLRPQATPFSGVVVVENGVGHVMADDPDDETDEGARPGGMFLRVDNGATELTDRLSTNATGMTRIMSAVTEGEHLNRTVLYYRRFRGNH